MQFLEKLWNRREKIDVLNQSKQKKERIIQYQKQINILQSFHRISISNRNDLENILSGKTNSLFFNLIIHQLDIDKVHLYDKDLYELKYQTIGLNLKHLNDYKVFPEYSNDMDDIYKDIQEHNPNKKRKILIFFDDRNAEMHSNKRLNPIVIELFIKGRKLNIPLVLITQSYLAVPKYIRLNFTL